MDKIGAVIVNYMKKNISVVGVPMWLGQMRFGTNLGPRSIRSAGLVERLKNAGNNVIDEGNLSIGITGRFRQNGENVKNLKTLADSSEKLAAKVSDMIEGQRFPLVLGGDHSIAIGTLAGLAKHYDNLGVIWYDAHADMNTPETSPSGNIHGMPLAASMGLGHPALTNIGGYQGKVKPEHVVLIGARDIDPGEQRLIAEKNIKVYTAQDVKRLGIKKVISETLEYLSARCDGIHLSFDVDGIDPAEIPGVGTPVAEGISYSESMKAVQLLSASNKLTSAEFVEVNPLLDKGDRTSRLTAGLIGALFGESAGSKQVGKSYGQKDAEAI
jgi:arginase